MKNYNVKNIKKGWKTTILGFVLALSGVAVILLDVATVAEATPLILIGIGLLPYSDNKEKESK